MYIQYIGVHHSNHGHDQIPHDPLVPRHFFGKPVGGPPARSKLKLVEATCLAVEVNASVLMEMNGTAKLLEVYRSRIG